jgi:hypothetical protein
LFSWVENRCTVDFHPRLNVVEIGRVKLDGVCFADVMRTRECEQVNIFLSLSSSVVQPSFSWLPQKAAPGQDSRSSVLTQSLRMLDSSPAQI